MLRLFTLSSLIFFLLVKSTLQEEKKRIFSTKNSDTYRAAVVQYYPIVKETGEKTVKENVNKYEQIIELTEIYNIDMIVFPEFGLSGTPMNKDHVDRLRVKMYQKDNTIDAPLVNLTKIDDKFQVKRSNEAMHLRRYYKDTAVKVPDPEDMINPCDSEDSYISEVLKILSCAAQESQIYVVVNLYEFVDCPHGCGEDNFFLYNTNVAFDRDGHVIARYRKFNINGEPWADQTEKLEQSWFMTDFGIKFGIFVGIDLLKYGTTPLFKILYSEVHDIVLSTHPFDEMPFLNSKHDQGSFAFKENKNLLAAGFSRDGGSGIFIGKYGWLEPTSFDWTKNVLMYADVPKSHVDACRRFQKIGSLNAVELKNMVTRKFKSHEVRGPSVLMDFEKDMSKYINSNYLATEPLDLEQDWFKERLCVGDVCCYFEIHMETNPADLGSDLLYRYRAMVFNGPYRFADGSWFGIETCALIACAGDKEEDCGKDHRSVEKKNATTFSTIFITRQATTNVDSFFGPLVSTKYDGGLPLRMNGHYSYIDNVDVRLLFNYPYALLVLVLLEPASEIEIFAINGRRFHIIPPSSFFMPENKYDYTHIFTVEITIFIIVLLAIILIVIIYKYRRQCGRLFFRPMVGEEHLPLEITSICD